MSITVKRLTGCAVGDDAEPRRKLASPFEGFHQSEFIADYLGENIRTNVLNFNSCGVGVVGTGSVCCQRAGSLTSKSRPLS